MSVVLRDLHRGDVDPCARAFADDPALARLIGVEAALSRGDVRRLIRREDRDRADGHAWRLAIADGGADTFLGLILLHTFHGRRAECGFFVIPAARGRGVAHEALRSLVDLAFDRLRLERVHLRTLLGNHPAQRVAERAGFVREGVEDDRVCFGAGATAWA